MTKTPEDTSGTFGECEELRALLREWLDTPFFAGEAEWSAWVSEYRPRVVAALYRNRRKS